jgi:hypothetical protein
MPFLDHKLAEFVATIPAKYKLRAWKKRVLIQALGGILPETILNRRKQVAFEPSSVGGLWL